MIFIIFEKRPIQPIDPALSATSENPAQNKAIQAALTAKEDAGAAADALKAAKAYADNAIQTAIGNAMEGSY